MILIIILKKQTKGLKTLKLMKRNNWIKMQKWMKELGVKKKILMMVCITKLILGPAPLLYVDVNLGPSKVSRIVLYEHDVPDEVALEFAKE
jgi:hypothetical protein